MDLARMALLVLLVVHATPSAAAILTLSDATLTLEIGGLPTVPLASNSSGVPVLVSDFDGSFTLPAGLFAGATTFPAIFPETNPYLHSVVLVNASGNLGPGLGIGSGFGGVVALEGTFGFNAGFFLPSIFELPLSVVGVGGSTRASPGSAQIGLWGSPWTTRTATADFPGIFPGTSSPTRAGFDARTASGAGTIQLVTPMLISSDFAGGDVPAFSVMTLTFVPEPGTAALFAVCLASVGWLGERRRPGATGR